MKAEASRPEAKGVRLAATLKRSRVVVVSTAVFFTGFGIATGAPGRSADAPQAAAPAARQAVRSADFERGVAGWAALRGRLVATRGVAGNAARVLPRPNRRSGPALFAAPRLVRSTSAGQVYAVRAWLRGSKRGQRICVVLREVKRGRVLSASGSCQVVGRSWKQSRVVTLRVKRSGSQVGFVVRSKRRARFDVDTMRLVLARRAGRGTPTGRPGAPTTGGTTTEPAPAPTTGPTTTGQPPAPTATTTPPATPVAASAPPAGARIGSFETGDFAAFDQTNASPSSGVADPTTLSVTSERAYDGANAARAHSAGSAAGWNKFSRAIYHNIGWGAGSDVWYGVAVYLPFGFYAAQQGQIDLLRWDNWVDDPTTTDRGGIVIYGPPAAGQAYLMRARLGSDQSELVGPFRISEGTWHWLEVHQRFSADHGSDLSEVFLDGTLVGRSSARNWNGRRIASIRFGLVAMADDRQANPLTMWFDRASISTAALGPR